MKVKFSFGKKSVKSLSPEATNIGLQVNFLYTYIDSEGELESWGVSGEDVNFEKQTYTEMLESEASEFIALNYTMGEAVGNQSIGYPAGVTMAETAVFQSISVYKSEIWPGGQEAITHPVVVNGRSVSFRDFNISNNRTYLYQVYPRSAESENAAVSGVITTNWKDWSLTELHPVEGREKTFTASLSDVWLFKYNVEPSDQTQNISKTQQDNLTAYPKFSRGLKNHITSSITCLLGSQMVSYDFVTKKQQYSQGKGWEDKVVPGRWEGGYTEKRPFVSQLTSNERIDMLNAWREVVYSGNPKLIKDRKGQKFLVQITEASNTTMDTYNEMPDQISFSWVEIGDLDDAVITSRVAY